MPLYIHFPLFFLKLVVCFVWARVLSSVFVESATTNLLTEPSEATEPRKLSEPVIGLNCKILGVRYFKEPQI